MLRDREKGRGRGKEKGREKGRGKERGREGKRERVMEGGREKWRGRGSGRGEEKERKRGFIAMLGHYTQKSSYFIRLVVSYNQFNGSLALHLCVQNLHLGIVISFQLYIYSTEIIL